MNHTEKEFELAKRYFFGECNDTQFNYIIHAEKLDRKNVERIIEQISYSRPMVAAAKLMLLYIFFNFLICTLFSLFDYFNR